MLLKELLPLLLVSKLTAIKENDFSKFHTKTISEVYDEAYYLMPRIYCADGFNISIQNNRNNYCASENGYRKFGIEWERVEWGFPSSPISANKYGADVWDNETEIADGVGTCSVELLQELIDEHGGIDFKKTIEEEVNRDKERTEEYKKRENR